MIKPERVHKGDPGEPELDAESGKNQNQRSLTSGLLAPDV
jgi:hypothetical protein